MCTDALKKQSLLVSTGLCNWKKAHKQCSHEQSKEHVEAVIAFNQRLKGLYTADSKLMKEIGQLEFYSKSVLKRAVSIIIFIVEHRLAFRGDIELISSPRNGNYLSILELIAQYDIFLAQHIQAHGNQGSGHTNYLLSTIMEELINAIGKQVLNEIIS